MSDYPELEKVNACRDETQVCAAFLDWLKDQRGVVLPQVSSQLLADFFEIDELKAEAEYQASSSKSRADFVRKLQRHGVVMPREPGREDGPDDQ